MGRMYSLVLAPAAVTVEATLAEIQAPADGVVKLHSVRVSQTTEEFCDANVAESGILG